MPTDNTQLFHFMESREQLKSFLKTKEDVLCTCSEQAPQCLPAC